MELDELEKECIRILKSKIKNIESKQAQDLMDYIIEMALTEGVYDENTVAINVNKYFEKSKSSGAINRKILCETVEYLLDNTKAEYSNEDEDFVYMNFMGATHLTRDYLIIDFNNLQEVIGKCPDRKSKAIKELIRKTKKRNYERMCKWFNDNE